MPNKGRYITDKQRSIVYQQSDGKCQYCLNKVVGYWDRCSPLSRWGQEGKIHFFLENCVIHHIVPLTIGGKDNFSNWALTCILCHKFVHSFLWRQNEILYPIYDSPILINNNNMISLNPQIERFMEIYHA